MKLGKVGVLSLVFNIFFAAVFRDDNEFRYVIYELLNDFVLHSNQIGILGNFGVVHKGIMNGKTEVAIKQLKEDTMSTREFLREANTMKLIRHDKV